MRFQVYTSTRHEQTKAGDVVEWEPEEFHALPPLETVATVAEAPKGELAAAIPIRLNARVNELGLLQVSCRSLAPDIPQSWPLEFNLRPHERNPAARTRGSPSPTQAEPNVAPAALAEAGRRISAAFRQPLPLGKRDKLTAPRLLQGLEQSLGRSKGDWNGILLRDLWTSLEESQTCRALSVEHEETWLILAGFLLRPGFGVPMDELRIDALWRIWGEGLRFPGKRTRLQEYILWRRLAGGLTGERQERLLAAEKDRIHQPKNAPPELIRMAGSFERIGPDLKAELIGRFIETVVELASEKRHCAPYLAALGLLLNRTPFYAGPESIVAPSLVESAYEALRKFDWNDPEFVEAQTLFLRAARAVDDRRLDLPQSLAQSNRREVAQVRNSPGQDRPRQAFRADRAGGAAQFVRRGFAGRVDPERVNGARSRTGPAALHAAGSFLGDFRTPDGVRNSSRKRKGGFGMRGEFEADIHLRWTLGRGRPARRGLLRGSDFSEIVERYRKAAE